MKKIHSFLVTAYMLGGLALIAATPWSCLQGMLVNSGGASLAVQSAQTDGVEVLRGSAGDQAALDAEATKAMERAAASRQLMLGILLFTLGGFLHAYERLRSERPVRVTVKKRKPLTLFWLEMKV